MCRSCFLISNVLNKKLWLLEIYLLKGEKLLSEEMEIVFTELLLSALCNHVKPPLHLLPIQKHQPHTETKVKKPSRSAKATTAKQTSSDKQPAAATKPLPAKQPSVKQPIRTTKQPSPVKEPVAGTKQPSSDKQPAPAAKPTATKQPSVRQQAPPATPTTAKRLPASSSVKQPAPATKVTAAKQPSPVKKTVPATTPTSAKQPSASSSMTSYLTSTDKPTAMKQPSSQQAITTADHEFDKMDVKEIKRFISARGVQVSTYRKSELIQLAKAVASMNLPNDPDFENDSIDTKLFTKTPYFTSWTKNP